MSRGFDKSGRTFLEGRDVRFLLSGSKSMNRIGHSRPIVRNDFETLKVLARIITGKVLDAGNKVVELTFDRSFDTILLINALSG
jgi:hypothetical protein